jgi:hypothetical protein
VKQPEIAIILSGIATLAVMQSPAAAAPTVRSDRQMTTLAAQIINDARSAQGRLVKHDTTAATTDIDRALAARRTLSAMAARNGMTAIVPIYTELDDTAVLSMLAKKHAQATASSTPTSGVVRSNVEQVTSLAIDLDQTRARLDAARKAIADKNDQAAQDSLAAVGSDLVATTVSEDAPLLTARQDLALAQAAIDGKHLQAASADLRQASKSLTAYSGSAHNAQALSIANAIDAATPITTTKTSSVAKRIDGWWASVKTWFGDHAA